MFRTVPPSIIRSFSLCTQQWYTAGSERNQFRPDPARKLSANLYALLFFFTLDVSLLARSHYSEGPATDHLDTGFSWFLCA